MVDNLHVQTRRVPLSHIDGDVSAMNVRAVSEIFGESQVMQALQKRVKELAQTDTKVLISGEAGSGRRLVARAIHSLSRDAGGPLITAQCSDGMDAVVATIATLHAAARRSAGSGQMIPQRTHGTLILDGLTDLSPRSQLELLERFGPTVHRETNGHHETQPRIIATLQGTPEAAMAQGTLHSAVAQAFRNAQLSVPPLRERGEDIESLAHYFLALSNSENDTAKTLSGASLLALREHTWPGNVQELRAAVQRAYVRADRELDLRSAITTSNEPLGDANEVRTLRIAVGTSLADAERWMISATLKKCGGNKTRAAALLGVSLKTLYNRLNAYRAQGLDLHSLDRELSEVAN